jgi:hypothetical protein
LRSSCKSADDPEWSYRSKLGDLLKYHRYGGWAIPWLVAFPKLSQNIVENLGVHALDISCGAVGGVIKVCSDRGIIGK